MTWTRPVAILAGIAGAAAVIALSSSSLAPPLSAQMPRDRKPVAAADRMAEFERSIAALEGDATLTPGSAAAQHGIGAFCFEQTKNPALTTSEKQAIVERGLAAEDRALAIDPDYVEALVYKNLFLRVQATMESDNPMQQQALVREADQLRNRALQLQKSAAPRATIPEGTVVPVGAAPPPPPPPPPPGVPEGSAPAFLYARTQYTTADGAPIERVKYVRPIYAPMVVASGIQGEVVVDATVDTRGRVAQLTVVRSLPMLTQATIDAVRQWEFAASAAPRQVTVTATFTPPPR